MTNKPRLVVACLMLAGGPAGCGNRTPSPEATTPGVGDPLARAAKDALGKIESPPVVPARDPWAGVPGNDPGWEPTAESVTSPPKALLAWDEVVRTVGGKVETGDRAGQRFALVTSRLLVIEGANALDVFFPATREGLTAGRAFLSSGLFTPEERKALADLSAGRKEAERAAGRFRVRLGFTDGANSDLPAHWLRVEFEPADGTGRPVAHAVVLAGNYTADDLFTRGKHRELNKLVRSHLGPALPAEELALRVRTLDNLADAAGYTATEALAAVERAVREAGRRGLEPAFGIDAAGRAFAVVAATNKGALGAWR